MTFQIWWPFVCKFANFSGPFKPLPSLLHKSLRSYTLKSLDCKTDNWVLEVTVKWTDIGCKRWLVSWSSGHPVAHPRGPAVQLDVLEILFYSLPKACICYSTKAEETKGIEESLLDTASQGNLTPLLQRYTIQWSWVGSRVALGPPSRKTPLLRICCLLYFPPCCKTASAPGD